MQINTYSNHRQLIQLKGTLEWCYLRCEQLITDSALPYFWLGDCPEKISSILYRQILGQETSLLIINAHQHFDANLFAASEGALRGGGTLVLLCPSTINEKDHFYTYIEEQLSQSPFRVISEDDDVKAIQLIQKPINSSLQLVEQNLAIEAIIKTVSGHRRRPLVLTANRGRGKSAALGIAAKQLVDSGMSKILICAPSKNATLTLFKHAGPSSCIEFIAADKLLNEKPHCDLLMIDEAAALPVFMLEEITEHYSRLVFATTLHGYEGSGRGFALRFQKRLREIAPQFRSLHLKQPIRWDKNDPVEQFTLQHLCLTESQTEIPDYDAQQSVQLQIIDTSLLLSNHALLSEIFSLLVIAHYQTKPSDLEKLLNDNNLTVLTLIQNKQILAVALINSEGDIDEQLAEKIYNGERRINGHLVAQSLTFHCAQKKAATHKYARIQRIATHPAIQRQGLGKLFIDEITNWATTQQFDHLCASFGATTELVKFWQDKQFNILRIGSTKDKSSGTHSFIVNLPISVKGKYLHQSIQQQFHLQLTTQLTRQLCHIDSTLVLSLLNELPNNNYQHPLLASYCSGNLPYEFAEFHLLTLIINSDLSSLAKSQQRLTIQKILQNRSWAEICQNNEYTGKKQAQLALRLSIKQLLTSTYLL